LFDIDNAVQIFLKQRNIFKKSEKSYNFAKVNSIVIINKIKAK